MIAGQSMLRSAPLSGAATGYPPSALEAASAPSELSTLVADRLGEAAELAATDADSRACGEARRQARRLAALFSGLTGQ